MTQDDPSLRLAARDCDSGAKAPAALGLFLVTIRLLDKDPDHNPARKVTSACAVTDECTDSTGEHHTFAAYGTDATSMRDAWNKAGRSRGYRVTRVEAVVVSPSPWPPCSFDGVPCHEDTAGNDTVVQ
jgi:hypothetical protein